MLGHLMTNSLGISQGHNVHSSCWLICGNWVKPFTVISCHQQSWYWITSFGYCWSAPDLSGWPERWDAKKNQPTMDFIPDPISSPNLLMTKTQRSGQADWLPFIILDVITSTVLCVRVCHRISKQHFHDWRRRHFPYCRATAQTSGTWVNQECSPYPLLCSLLREWCHAAVKFRWQIK